ncbi:hypothetical protein AOL_s00110g214 [Orbilia oligospora ATCC 24927]|uniref:BTB domain-containing protein n=1 Tax=Arthrobotrys oligospora (strain ATCC 24927 / CBS 115.81 / DSM 1491) TaxID=756982 RepID=G1XL44_ARTOA|nr:hypothetical protein AOL_s00110g214 [Orbilia oligospora ATCC 24927]EGX46050.1 hypothetical protein AOL_s00110g214 [Orbilia oligospora ATCC 24927]
MSSSSTIPSEGDYLPPLPRTIGLGSLQSRLNRAKSLSQPQNNSTELPVENKRASVYIPAHKRSGRRHGILLQHPSSFDNLRISSPEASTQVPSDSKDASTQTPIEKPILMKVLEDPQFSDITVYIGPSKETFHLHREILSFTSNFFKDFCTALRSSKTMIVAQIYLPHLDPTMFRTIINWQYSGNLTLDLTSTPCPLTPLYRTIEFLKLPALRIKFFDTLITFCRTNFCNLTGGGRAIFIGKFNELCGVVKPSDLGKLIECMEVIVEHFVVLPDAFLEALEGGAVSNVFVAAFIGARRNLGHWRSCGKCFDIEREEKGVRGYK